MDQAFYHVIRETMIFLVKCDYFGLEKFTMGRCMSADDIRKVICEYGRTVILPEEGFENYCTVVEVAGENKHWSVWCPLWTLEEGRSDLSVELSVFPSHMEEFRVELDDIHVL